MVVGISWLLFFPILLTRKCGIMRLESATKIFLKKVLDRDFVPTWYTDARKGVIIYETERITTKTWHHRRPNQTL